MVGQRVQCPYQHFEKRTLPNLITINRILVSFIPGAMTVCEVLSTGVIVQQYLIQNFSNKLRPSIMSHRLGAENLAFLNWWHLGITI